MSSIISESNHQLSEAAMYSGRCPEMSLNQVSPGAGKIKSEAWGKVDPSPLFEVSAVYVKEEPKEETEDFSIKEEPFLYGNEACLTEHLSPAPAFYSCVPFKLEAQVEAHTHHSSSSQNISALLCHAGGSVPASGDAAGGADVSEASSSKQHLRLGCSQCGLVGAGAGQLQHLEHFASNDHQCHSCLKSSATEAQHILSRHPQGKSLEVSGRECADGCKEILHKRCLSTHSAMKKFGCSDCDYACKTKKALRRHFLQKHSTEKHIHAPCTAQRGEDGASTS
ncbi:uncharacterized protein LOC125178201 [Hyalella azteca]|uniref:Uncharacterized protein LOC125178201 n=1 Tax=Hyalella azteca TaxID=294128 RepID=A0A979FK35_HYAAZ|nr:uncharacterized protein LOC125178201 [Hyalella azteca]